MKQTITICLDSELIELLKKEDNYSALINDLASGYFNKGGSESIEALNEKEMQLRKQMNSVKQELIDVQSKLSQKMIRKAETEKKVGNIPESVLQDFKQFNAMDEHILLDRFKHIYSEEYDFTWTNLLEAWKAFKEGHKDD